MTGYYMPMGKGKNCSVIVVYLQFYIVRAESLYKRILFNYFQDS